MANTLSDDDLRQVMADWMREIGRNQEHCPLTKPELMTALRQIADGKPVTVSGDASIERRRRVVVGGVVRDEKLGHELLPPQIARLSELVEERRKHGLR